MIHVLGGVVLGAVLMKVSSNRIRPALRDAVKAGFKVSRKTQEFGLRVRHDAEDLVAEAKAELDQEATGSVSQ